MSVTHVVASHPSGRCHDVPPAVGDHRVGAAVERVRAAVAGHVGDGRRGRRRAQAVFKNVR